MIQLTEEEARDRLKQMIQADAEPELTTDDLYGLLEVAKRSDEDGLAPSETQWTPTWDLNAAARDGGCARPARSPGASSHRHGATLHRAQIFASCLKLADKYGARVAVSVSAAGHKAEPINVVANL